MLEGDGGVDKIKKSVREQGEIIVSVQMVCALFRVAIIGIGKGNHGLGTINAMHLGKVADEWLGYSSHSAAKIKRSPARG